MDLAPDGLPEAEQAVRRKVHSHRPVNRVEDGFPIAVYIAWNAFDAQPPSSRGRDSGVIQDSRRTNTPRTPCQPKHLLAFTVPARLIRGNIGNPTGLATDPEKTSNMLGTENLFSQILQAREEGNNLLNADCMQGKTC